MSPVNNYKKMETHVVDKLAKFFRFIGSAIISFFKYVIQKGKQRFTVMFIPHSEKKIMNFHISIFSLIFIGTLIVILIVSFFMLSTYFAGSKEKYEQVSLDLDTKTKSLENIENAVKQLAWSSDELRYNMSELFGAFGEEESDTFAYTGLGGDLNNMNETINNGSGSSQTTDELKELTNYIDSLNEPIQAIRQYVVRQKELLIHTPSLWPVMSRKGKVGRITAYFGPEEHPFTHTFRLHNGVDIAWTRGTPVVATANGTIEAINYDANGLGHNITIRHKKYGFRTRYGHLDKILVNRGQQVERGDVIGYMGSSGLSTGPHLHYEVHVGDQVVDPMQYLDMNSELIEK